MPFHATVGHYYFRVIWKKGCKTNRVSKALRLLLRGCCSRQLTAGLPAVGRVIALSTRLVMACTANTFNWVRSKSSWWQKNKQNIETKSTACRKLLYYFLMIKHKCGKKATWNRTCVSMDTSCCVSSSWSIVIGWVTSTPSKVAQVSSNWVLLLQPEYYHTSENTCRINQKNTLNCACTCLHTKCVDTIEELSEDILLLQEVNRDLRQRCAVLSSWLRGPAQFPNLHAHTYMDTEAPF